MICDLICDSIAIDLLLDLRLICSSTATRLLLICDLICDSIAIGLLLDLRLICYSTATRLRLICYSLLLHCSPLAARVQAITTAKMLLELHIKHQNDMARATNEREQLANKVQQSSRNQLPIK